MKNIVKSRKKDADYSSSFSRLPDEIILQIFNKLIDLKTLCFCNLVSKRFSSIVPQVNAVSFTASFLNPCILNKNTVGDVGGGFHRIFIRLLMKPLTYFLSKFKAVKSLLIEFSSSSHTAVDNRCLFKWKVTFGNRIESFVLLSPTLILDKDEYGINGHGFEEEYDDQHINDMFEQYYFDIAKLCLKDVMVWHMNLLYIVKDLPLLEEVSITDSRRTGRLSLRGKKLSEVKEWVNSVSESEMNNVEVPDVVSNAFYSPGVELPVSGYVMKGIYGVIMEVKDFQGGYDGLKKSEDGFEDKEEAAYTEAIKDIFEYMGIHCCVELKRVVKQVQVTTNKGNYEVVDWEILAEKEPIFLLIFEKGFIF